MALPRSQAEQCSRIHGPVRNDKEPPQRPKLAHLAQNQRRMSSGDSLDFIVLMCFIPHVHTTVKKISAIARASSTDLPLPATSRDYKITLLAAIFAPESS